MKKYRILSLLAASAIFISAYAPSAALAEGGWGETYHQEKSADQQDFFISVPSGGSVADYFDEHMMEHGPKEDAPTQPPEKTPKPGKTTPSPTEEKKPEKPSSDATPGDSKPTGSNFVLDGKALVRYRGSESLVFVPEGVTVIRSGAFAGNKYINSVYLPDSVTEIQGGAFENCSNLNFIVTSGRSQLTTIGAYAFAGCFRLDISFSSDVKNVSPIAFPSELTATPAPKATPTPKPTPTMKATPAKPSMPSDPLIPGSGTAAHGSLKITRQPVSVRAQEGDFVSFIVVAEGAGKVHYQWMRSKDGVNWVKIENSSKAFENASTNVLSFTATAVRAAYQFKCVITNWIDTVESNIVSVILMNGQGATPVPGTEDPWAVTVSPTPAASGGHDTHPQAPGSFITGSAPHVSAQQISNSSALISWTPMKNAVSYELYRHSVSLNGNQNEEFILLGTFTDTSYTDTNLNFTGYQYAYSLKAVLKVPQKEGAVAITTDFSNTTELKILAAPTGVFAQRETDTSVRITWNSSELATSYMISRSMNGGKFFILAQSLTGLEYVDQSVDLSKNTYQYKVWAEMAVPGSDEPFRKASEPVRVEKSEPVQEEETINPGETIVIGNVEYTITDDGAVVTAYNGNASSLTIPATIRNGKYTVIAIGANVFWGNKSLEKISLPKTIRVIETGAFAYCSADIQIADK